MQRALDNAILKEKPEMKAEERFDKTLVALSVEIAELANTAEHFKFWKENKGKIDSKRFIVTPGIANKIIDSDYYDKNNDEHVTTEQAHKLTLVEEASDCLHFILSLANQLDIELEQKKLSDIKVKREFSYSIIQYSIGLMGILVSNESQIELLDAIFRNFYVYAFMLGITTQELEQAYYEKNEVNYQRLREGY